MTNENVDSGNDNNTSSGTSSTSTAKAAKQGTIVDVLGGISGKQVISEVLGSSSTGGNKVSFGDYKFIGSINSFLYKHATHLPHGSLLVKADGTEVSISGWVVVDSEAYNMFKSEKIIYVSSNGPTDKMVFGPLYTFEYMPNVLIEYEGIDPSKYNSNVLVLANNAEAISLISLDVVIFEEGTVDIKPGTMDTQVHE